MGVLSPAPWAAAVLVLAAVPGAQAATVEISHGQTVCEGSCSKYSGPEPTTTLLFKAEPGEANHVTLTQSADRAKLTITDSGATLKAGTDCSSGDQHTVTCPTPFTGLQVQLGDQADSFSASFTFGMNVDGGPGDDVINGSVGADRLQGGGGRDRLSGGDGSDTLADGDAGTPDADIMDGGAGNDMLDYSAHTVPVTVDLRAAAAGTGQGAPGEGDQATAFEGARGGAGDDTITGNAGPNSLDGGAGDDVLVGLGAGDALGGGPGADRLSGSGGRDSLAGGPGRDELDSGPGDDYIASYDHAVDQIRCGAGKDMLDDRYPTKEVDDYGDAIYQEVGPDPRDLLRGDCERAATAEEVVQLQPVKATARSLTFAHPPCRCRGKLALSVGGRLLGSARWGRSGRIAVTLKRSIPHGAHLRVRWSWQSGYDRDGADYTLLR